MIRSSQQHYFEFLYCILQSTNRNIDSSSNITFWDLKLVVLFIPQAALFNVHNLAWILRVWTVGGLQSEVSGCVSIKTIVIVRPRGPKRHRKDLMRNRCFYHIKVTLISLPNVHVH